jgi:tetratricopeptide (TPR) repeat protein
MIEAPIRTTNGAIALFNLDAQIDGLERHAAQGRLTSRSGAELVDLLTLRGQILGRIADYERAAELSEQRARELPADGLAFLTRARTRACLHRFDEALADLDLAAYLGLGGPEPEAERAAIFLAVGRYEEALTMYRAAAERRRSFETLGALAVLHAERGEVDVAEHFFEESRAHFRGASPFAIAQLDFRHAHLWLAQGDLTRARGWLLAAWRRVPAYAPAEGHLAEVEAELGEYETAIARLRRLAVASDDPDYAAQLARILGLIGRYQEAARWKASAEDRYDELVALHPAAFADHAAEFFLTVGGDPQRALRLAKQNAGIRRTPRADALFSRAIAACATGRPLDAA